MGKQAPARSSPRLILVEGICGAGKTTLAGKICGHLRARGVPARFFDEGAPRNPASLNWHAFFRPEEYEALLREFPTEAQALRANAIADCGNILMYYRDIPAFSENEALYRRLRERELCWAQPPAAPQPVFSAAAYRQWERFARAAAAGREVWVLEGVFLQHPVHDLSRLYGAGETQIAAHVAAAAGRVAPLRPVLLYLSPSDVETQQKRSAALRENPRYAAEEQIRLMEARRGLERRLLRALPFPVFEIETEPPDWVRVWETAAKILRLHGFP